MSKSKGLLVFLRVMQALGSFTFFVFWSWSCSSQYLLQTPGDYFVGFYVALTTLPLCVVDFWALKLGKPSEDEAVIVYHRAWARDLAVTGPWLTVVLNTMLSTGFTQSLTSSASWETSNSMGVETAAAAQRIAVRQGLRIIAIVMVVTFFMTTVLLFVEAMKRRAATAAREADTQERESQAQSNRLNELEAFLQQQYSAGLLNHPQYPAPRPPPPAA